MAPLFATLLLAACSLLQSGPAQETRVIPDDPASYAGAWQARGILVAGEDCAPSVELRLLVRGTQISGAGFIGVGAPREGRSLNGRLAERGRWDAEMVGDRNQAVIATATGWLRDANAIGLMETTVGEVCLWRLHLRRI